MMTRCAADFSADRVGVREQNGVTVWAVNRELRAHAIIFAIAEMRA